MNVTQISNGTQHIKTLEKTIHTISDSCNGNTLRTEAGPQKVGKERPTKKLLLAKKIFFSQGKKLPAAN